MSGHLLAPTPVTKPPPSSRLPQSIKRPASGRAEQAGHAAPEKRIKLQGTGRPAGGLRRSMSSDNLHFPVKSAPLARSKLQQQPLASTLSNRTNLRKAESTLSVSTKRAVHATANIHKAGSHANIVDINENEGFFIPPAAKKTKRPAWDLKGRLQDQELESERRHRECVEMNRNLTDGLSRIAQLEMANNVLKVTVQEKETISAVATSEVDTLRRQLLEKDEVIRTKDLQLEDRANLVAVRDASLASERSRLIEKDAQIARQIEDMKSTNDAVSRLKGNIACLEGNLSSMELRLEEALESNREKQGTIDSLLATLTNKDSQIVSFEKQRRDMHNQIQELKGNIRVFVRVRPFLKSEVQGIPLNAIPHIRKPDAAVQSVELVKPLGAGGKLTSRNGAESATFSFDAVLMPDVTQHAVFAEVSQLVQSALDGYNVCIFAYGQTGAGKTYTMEGYGQGDDMGIIPRSVSQIFKSMTSLEPAGWKFTLKGMFVEIYNETLQDLLCKKGSKLEIKSVEGKKDEVFVTNLTYVEILSENQIFKLLKTAQQNRAVAATHCNERSSRSHFVFQLQLVGTNSRTGENNAGTLNLVDLAGSERLKESLSEGDRLTETKNINKSLSNLGNVIMALAQKNPHVPYRNSKLTYLLSNSLGGNSKTLMLVNVSPKEEHYNESLNSLRFATKVNQCHIGTAIKKTKMAN